MPGPRQRTTHLGQFEELPIVGIPSRVGPLPPLAWVRCVLRSRADEFLLGGQAGGASLDFAEPPVELGFLDAFAEVADDLDQPASLLGIHRQHGTANAGMFVLAGLP